MLNNRDSALMTMFRRILCPVDFSDHSIAVLEEAVKLAQRNDALLYLLHVEFVPMNSPVQLARYANVSMEPNRRRVEQIAADRLQSVRHEILLRSGWPGTVIESAAIELEVDLVVIATVGWMSPTHPLGNVAQHVVRASKCPVLSFGPRAKLPILERILCPIDFDPNSIAAMKFAGKLAEENGAAVVLLHVVPVAVETSQVSPQEPSTDERDQAARLRLTKIAEENLGPDANCERQVRRGDPIQVILEVSRESRTDLIVMATHGRTALSYLFLGSVALRIVRDSEVPVATIRER